MFTALLFIVILALLVLVHEFGHFISAKRGGMRVDEFGFGFPPRLFGIQKLNGKYKLIVGHPKNLDTSATVYSFNLIPLGGFVKIFGENADAGGAEGSFTSKSFGRKLLTLLAGVIMNVLLAWVLISVGYAYGLPVGIDSSAKFPDYVRLTNPTVVLVDVDPESPAGKAGLKPNEEVVSLDGRHTENAEEFQEYIKSNKGKQFIFEVQRGNTVETIKVDSLLSPPEGKGSVGITMVTLVNMKYPVHYAFLEGAKSTVAQTVNIFRGLYKLLSDRDGVGQLGGPVKIAQITGQVADMGFIYLLQFTAFLSLNLAVLNVMPFPALDGGRVLFLVIEKIRRKPNNARFEQYANTFGFMLLLLLMLVVTVKDIVNF